MRTKSIIILLAVFMAVGVMACNSGGSSVGASSSTNGSSTDAMNRPIDASSAEAYQQYMSQLGQELNEKDLAQAAKAIMIVSMDHAMKSMKNPSAMQGSSPDEIKAQTEAAQAEMLAYINGKSPNQLIDLAEEAEARLKSR